MIYQEILDSGDPDAVYEHFWYNFKDSVSNFGQIHPIIETLPIEGVSNQLNVFKSTQDYKHIIEKISSFLVEYLWTCLSSDSVYHLNINYTNLRRWLDLPNTQESHDCLLDLQLLKVIYSLIPKIGITFIKEFDLEEGAGAYAENIIKNLASRAYLLKNSLILSRLTEHDLIRPYVICMLYQMGIKVPHTIKNGSKILAYK